jgi:hypothetical protein
MKTDQRSDHNFLGLYIPKKNLTFATAKKGPVAQLDRATAF